MTPRRRPARARTLSIDERIRALRLHLQDNHQHELEERAEPALRGCPGSGIALARTGRPVRGDRSRARSGQPQMAGTVMAGDSGARSTGNRPRAERPGSPGPPGPCASGAGRAPRRPPPPTRRPGRPGPCLGRSHPRRRTGGGSSNVATNSAATGSGLQAAAERWRAGRDATDRAARTRPPADRRGLGTARARSEPRTPARPASRTRGGGTTRLPTRAGAGRPRRLDHRGHPPAIPVAPSRRPARRSGRPVRLPDPMTPFPPGGGIQR